MTIEMKKLMEKLTRIDEGRHEDRISRQFKREKNGAISSLAHFVAGEIYDQTKEENATQAENLTGFTEIVDAHIAEVVDALVDYIQELVEKE